MCGLYETARELMSAEQSLGCGVWAFDPVSPQKAQDRGVSCQEELGDPDVIIDHSGVTGAIMDSGVPIIHMRHGRPRSTYLLDSGGDIPGLYSHVQRVGADQRYSEIVTFWPEHVSHWELLTGRKVHCIPAPVDLDAWTPDGPDGYQFGGHRGKVNVVIADAWRHDNDPFDAITELAQIPDITLHMYAIPSGSAFKALVSRVSNLGEVKPRVAGLDNVYRAADVVVSCNRIDTRTVREAMACGCPVIKFPCTGLSEQIELLAGNESERRWARRGAEDLFSPEKSARALLDIIESVT